MLPRADSLKDKLRDATYFSKFDARQGFFQIPLAEESYHLTAFAGGGFFCEYTVLPFGIKTASIIFQRKMDDLLAPFIHGDDSFVLVYVDDVLIYSKSFGDHLKHLKLVLDAFQSIDLQLAPDKCEFLYHKIEYLGEEIGSNTCRPLESKVSAIKNMMPPTNRSLLKSFLGLTNYYSKYVPEFRQIVAPLDRLTSVKVDFDWSDACQAAFEKVKEILVSDRILTIFDPSLQHIVSSDASDYAIGAILYQIEPNGDEKVVEFFSRALNSAQRNYFTQEKEALAFLEATNHWRHYLWLKKFVFVTDHHSLCQLRKVGKTKMSMPSHQRVARWALALQDFNFEVRYKKGSLHLDADCLSRCAFPRINFADLLEQELNLNTNGPNGANHYEDFSLDSIGFLNHNDLFFSIFNDDFHRDRQSLIQIQAKDPFIQKKIEILTASPVDEKTHNSFVVLQGVLWKLTEKNADKQVPRRHRFVVPEAYQFQALMSAHDELTAGHFGQKKTLERLSESLFWTEMHKDCIDFVKSCDICQRRNPKNKKDQKVISQVSGIDVKQLSPNGFIIMDTIDFSHCPSHGMKHVIVAVDFLTRYVYTKAVKQPNGQNVVAFLQNEVMKKGRIQRVLSDNATYFKSKEIVRFYSENNIKESHGTPYHPMTQGLAEKMVGMVKKDAELFCS